MPIDLDHLEPGARTKPHSLTEAEARHRHLIYLARHFNGRGRGKLGRDAWAEADHLERVILPALRQRLPMTLPGRVRPPLALTAAQAAGALLTRGVRQ